MATAVLGARRSRGRIARHILRASVTLFIAALLFLLAGVAWLYWRARACLPQLDGTIVLPGIAAPVEVLRDAQGVPHLRAQCLDDLMFVQGYVTAQDRLWQMDLSRRLARGELSEIFGKRTLEYDIENRRLGLSEAADQGVNGLDPASRRVLAAYARGVNAFIASHLNRLPIEFVLLHYRPRQWRETDSLGVALNMAKTLNSSWRTDVMRERMRRKLPPDLYADLFPDRSPLDHPVAQPVSRPIKVAHPDATGALITAGRPRLPARLPARLPVHLPATAARLWDPPIGPMESATWPHPQNLSRLDSTLAALLASDQEPDLAFGSNNWALSGAHTLSGKPLLVNDPHLGHSIPSVWYEVELEAPELHATGVSLPGGPLVIIGHNEHVAWGMTNTGPDVQDIYLETFKPEDPRKYLVNGRWVDAEMGQEHIKVRGSAEVDLTVKSTRHGPVIGEDSPYAMALKWTALQPHAVTFPFLKVDQARNWQEFIGAIRQFTGPQQNMVYADVEGNVAYYAPGWVPIRGSGDGSLPVRGDIDEHEWLGYVPFEDLPHSYNPPGGIIATANSRVVPDGYPYFLTHAWAAAWRTARIFQMLEAGANFDVESMLRIDTDIHSLEDIHLAQDILDAAAARPPDNPEVKFALKVLRDWDGSATADSKATLICEVTRSLLFDRILRPKLGDSASDYHWALGFTFIENAIRHNWTRWLPPGDADFDMTLMRSLETALQRIPQLVGSRNPRDWNWGKTIPLTFHHPLDRLPEGRRIFDVGPFIQTGTGTTVKATTSLSGPSMRMVVDLSDLDNSVNNITLGESGQVFSRYYRDQFPAWYTGHSFPMLFSHAAVSKGAVHSLRFLPLK